jgi:hypothetical protein
MKRMKIYLPAPSPATPQKEPVPKVCEDHAKFGLRTVKKWLWFKMKLWIDGLLIEFEKKTERTLGGEDGIT